MSDSKGPVKVTISVPETGEVLEERMLSNDYMIICNGIRYVKSCQIWGSTHQVNIACGRPETDTGGQ